MITNVTMFTTSRSLAKPILFQETVQSERSARDPGTAGCRLLLRVLHALLSEMLQMLCRRWWPEREPHPSTEGHFRLPFVGCPWRQVGLDTKDDTKRSQARQGNHGVETALQPDEEYQHKYKIVLRRMTSHNRTQSARMTGHLPSWCHYMDNLDIAWSWSLTRDDVKLKLSVIFSAKIDQFYMIRSSVYTLVLCFISTSFVLCFTRT